MTAAIVVLLYVGTTLSMFFLTREQKRREGELLSKIEKLEDDMGAMRERENAGMEKVHKINRMATELLCVLQEKEDDIRELLKRVDEKRREPVYRPAARPDLSVASDEGLSASERHTIEMLRRRRSG